MAIMMRRMFQGFKRGGESGPGDCTTRFQSSRVHEIIECMTRPAIGDLGRGKGVGYRALASHLSSRLKRGRLVGLPAEIGRGGRER